MCVCTSLKLSQQQHQQLVAVGSCSRGQAASRLVFGPWINTGGDGALSARQEISVPTGDGALQGAKSPYQRRVQYGTKYDKDVTGRVMSFWGAWVGSRSSLGKQ